jgi:hypothetical protein
MKVRAQFKGSPDEDFERGFQIINRYIRYYKYHFPSDHDKINWLESILENNAQDWYKG